MADPPDSLFNLQCASCGEPYPASGFPATCPACNGFWSAPELVWREPLALSGLRRWSHVLGLDPEELPVREMTRLAMPADRAWISQQGSEPAGSYKERGAEVMMAAARRRGVEECFLDSSGNAGIAVARAAAARGIRCSVLVPESTPEAKQREIARWGGSVEVVPGDRQATALAAERLRAHLPYASHVYQPAFPAGVATLVWDLLQDLEQMPGRWWVPAANGALLSGIGIGLTALLRAGRIDRLPVLSAVQLAGYAALHPEGPGERAPGPPVAAGLAIARPQRREEMLAWIERTAGEVTRVSEEEVATARSLLARECWYTDATGAAAFAGFLQRTDRRDAETVVVVSSREAPPEM